ncbi:MAG: LPS assembly lipoprotein LptE [Gemmatimonadaceae bacterium]
MTAGCVYGFAGGGLPAHVKTIAVIPFENETTSSEIQRELVDALRTELRDRLGVREAPESRANAIVRGTIQRYEVDIPVAYSADNRATTTARRMLQIVVDIELVDQVTGETLWQRKGFVADGTYEERGEPAARKEAIGRVVNALVEGAQSQW